MQNKKGIHSRVIIIILLLIMFILCFIYFIDKSDYGLVLLYENGSTDIIHEFVELEVIKCIVIEEIDFMYAEDIRLSLYKRKQLEQKMKQSSDQFSFLKMKIDSGILENGMSIVSGIEQSDSEIIKSGIWYQDSIKNFNETTYTGSGTKITVIDSGIDLSIEAINKNFNSEDSHSYLKNDESLIDRTGHGTMVSGIISTIAPDANVVIYKVTGEGGNTSSLAVINAIVDAVKNGSDVINISLGAFIDSRNETGNIMIKAFQRAVDYAMENNVLIFSSAGNISINLDDLSYQDTIYVPAMLRDVVTINSINKNDIISSYSNYGSDISFSMPGGDFSYIDGVEDEEQKILVYFPEYLLEDNNKNGKTLTTSTSIATPMAAGIWLLYLEKFDVEKLAVYEILDIIINDCEDLGELGKDVLYGYGKMSAPVKDDN